MESRNGELHIILGPMFSGKTTKLIELSARYKSFVMVNFAEDVRYHPTLLSTHDKKMVPCLQTKEITPLFCHKDIIASDAIFINEGQFFPDLYSAVKILVEQMGKKVYIGGLDGDFLRQPFGDIFRLIPLCDTVEKLKARCERCPNHAIFSHRIISDQQQIIIGSDEYIPLCRACFLSIRHNL